MNPVPPQRAAIYGDVYDESKLQNRSLSTLIEFACSILKTFSDQAKIEIKKRHIVLLEEKPRPLFSYLYPQKKSLELFFSEVNSLIQGVNKHVNKGESIPVDVTQIRQRILSVLQKSVAFFTLLHSKGQTPVSRAIL